MSDIEPDATVSTDANVLSEMLSCVDSDTIIAHLLARRDPKTCLALFSIGNQNRPMFVSDWYRTSNSVLHLVDDLFEVMNWLRDDKLYAQADRIRTLLARLAKSVPHYPVFFGDREDLIRNVVRTYPEQLSIKESKALLKQIEALKNDFDTLSARLAEVQP